MIDGNLGVPFETTIPGVPVTVVRVDVNEHEQIVAICSRDGDRLAVPILDLPLPMPRPKGADWIEAYREWTGES